MGGGLDPSIQSKIGTMPDFILKTKTWTSRTSRNAMIADSLRKMEVGQAIIYTPREFEEEYGKHGKMALIASLRKQGLKHAAVVNHNDKVYVFLRSKL